MATAARGRVTAPDNRDDAATTRAVTPRPRRTVKVVAAGDLCGDCRQTARRARAQHPDVVVTMGDLAYDNGLLSEFRRKYAGGTTPPTRWGSRALKRITFPGYGNHDCFDVPRGTGSIKQGCSGAVAYFGPDRRFGSNIRGTPGSYHTVVGNWLIVHLNSAGKVGSGQATPREVRRQRQALRRVLRADRHRCELVVWHHPRYSSGHHGNNGFVDPWFDTAYAAGVDVVLSGHDHDYERFARQDGRRTRRSDGVLQFVVGTGGGHPRQFHGAPEPHSLVRIADKGILTMKLRPNRSFSFAFLHDRTGTVDDSGRRRCHS
jgi:hypothetical protein